MAVSEMRHTHVELHTDKKCRRRETALLLDVSCAVGVESSAEYIAGVASVSADSTYISRSLPSFELRYG